jgi:Mn2+/Fe2+ NRAMP family transporter
VIAASTLVGMGINFLHVNAIAALFWTAVINGFLTPPLLVIIMLVANNPRVMGRRVNGRWTNLLGWMTVLVTTAAAAALALTWGKG